MSGDFNVDMLATDALQAQLTLLLISNALHNASQVPTCVTCNSLMLIDLLVTNTDKHCITAGALVFDLGDHLPIF